MEIYQAVETAEFIQLVNDWFDIFNSHLHTFSYPGKVQLIIIIFVIFSSYQKEPYGLRIENQRNVLGKMTEAMSHIVIPGKTKLPQFPEGILMNNKVLDMLHQDLVKYNMSYILTYRLNQDVLENFFGAMRSKGSPFPQRFQI